MKDDSNFEMQSGLNAQVLKLTSIECFEIRDLRHTQESHVYRRTERRWVIGVELSMVQSGWRLESGVELSGVDWVIGVELRWVLGVELSGLSAHSYGSFSRGFRVCGGWRESHGWTPVKKSSAFMSSESEESRRFGAFYAHIILYS